MMAASQVFQNLFDYSDGVVTKYITGVAASTASSFHGFAQSLLLIYMALWGWSMIRGLIQEPVMDGAIRMIKISIIFALATSSALYAQYVSDFFYNWPTELASQLQGVPATTSAQMLDKGTTLAGSAWEKASIANLGAYILAAIVYVLTWVTTGISGVIIIMAKLTLAITLALGPLFILGLMFEPSKRWFDSWLGAAVTEGLAMVMTILAATMGFKLMNAAYDATMTDAAANSGIATMSAISGLVIYGMASLFVIQRMPSLAGSIGGSFSSGSENPVGWAYNKLKGATSGSVALGKSTYKGGRATYKGISRTAGKFGKGSGGGSVTGSSPSKPAAIYRKITTRRNK